MLSIAEKTLYRSELFRHLDGIAFAPVVTALHEKGVFDYLLEKKECSLQSLCDHFSANEGYLNIGLRMLASQGWLEYDLNRHDNSVTLRINNKSSIGLLMANRYEDVVNFMKISAEFHPRHFELEQFTILNLSLIHI